MHIVGIGDILLLQDKKIVYHSIINKLKPLITDCCKMDFLCSFDTIFDETFLLATSYIRELVDDCSVTIVSPLCGDAIGFGYASKLYDRLIYPQQLLNCTSQKLLTERNRWLAQNADIIIAHVADPKSETSDILQQASKEGKKIIVI